MIVRLYLFGLKTSGKILTAFGFEYVKKLLNLWYELAKKKYLNLYLYFYSVLFPGGDDILQSSGFGRTGKIIFDIATKVMFIFKSYKLSELLFFVTLCSFKRFFPCPYLYK